MTKKVFNKKLSAIIGGILLFSFISSPLISLAQSEPLDSGVTWGDTVPEPLDPNPGTNTGGPQQNTRQCEGWNIFSIQCLLEIIANIFGVIAWLFSWLTWVANKFFNAAISFSVEHFKEYFVSAGVKEAWAVGRDLVNVLLIFILLYVAVSIILRLAAGEHKRMLTRVIIIALLVNFSFFATGVVIDVSNVIASTFLTAAAGNTGQANATRDISTQLVRKMGIGWNASGAEPSAPTEGGGGKVVRTLGGIVSAFIGKIFMLLVTTFVLFAGGLLFMIRSIVLVFLLVLSPFAFLFWILPKTRGWADKWWSQLINQSLFAPAFLFCFYLVIKVVSNAPAALKGGVSSGQGGLADFANTLVFFILVNGLMLASLIIAKQLSVTGASGAMKLAGLATGGLTAAGVWAGKQPLRGAGKILGAVDEKYLGGKMGKIYGGLKGGLGGAARRVGKVPGVGQLGRKVGEIVKHPIAAGAAGLAAATAGYGIPSILGKGTKEEEEKAKKENRRLEILGIQNQLKGLRGEKDTNKARQKAFELLKDVKPNEMAEHFSDDVLTMPAVIANYTPHSLESFARTGVKGKVMTAIFDEIQKPENNAHPARKYVESTLARKMWWTPPPTPAPAPTTPLPTSPPTPQQTPLPPQPTVTTPPPPANPPTGGPPQPQSPQSPPTSGQSPLPGSPQSWRDTSQT